MGHFEVICPSGIESLRDILLFTPEKLIIGEVCLHMYIEIGSMFVCTYFYVCLSRTSFICSLTICRRALFPQLTCAASMHQGTLVLRNFVHMC